jgi:hypothetical protein
MVGVAGSGGDGLIYTSPDAGATWKQTSAPSNNWTSVRSSADGIKLVAVAGALSEPSGTLYAGGAIYHSSDAGATWTPAKAPPNNWTSVASSADGARLVAAAWDSASGKYVGQGAIYCSSDAGATWTQTSAPSNNYWSGVASSADGTKLVAVSQDIGIYRSLDAGATWTALNAPSSGWSSIASSADGTTLVAAGGDSIYISIDSGVTWTATGMGGASAVASSADGYRLMAAGYDHIFTWPYSGPWRLANAPPNDWSSVACSADGTKLVAVGSGFVDRSGDSGATWTQTSAPTFFRVDSSADGTKLVALGDGIYHSSDAGATWTRSSAPSDSWTSVASSADGTKLVASAAPFDYPGAEAAIYRSSDSGTTWIRTSAPSNAWSCVASSADGTKLVAVTDPYTNDYWGTSLGDGAIYYSADSGATWTRTSAPSNTWVSVASSANGTKLVAAARDGYPGLIYKSSDSGATWEPTGAPTNWWVSVACSADGTILFAAASADGLGCPPWDGDTLKISTNSGVSWASAGLPGWSSSAVASSADGTSLVAVGYNGHIATLHAPAPTPTIPRSPELAVGPSGGYVGLSWLLPSTTFVLQQNSDLSSSDWVTVPTTPTLNLTNLHYQLKVTPGPGKSFFRLAQQ